MIVREGDIKRLISEKTGVPAALLDGATAEEIIAKARSLLEYRSQHEAQRSKTGAEEFGEWFRAQLYGKDDEDDHQDAVGKALDEIAEAVRTAQGGYPIIRDGGSVDPSGFPDRRPAREQFAEWFREKTAYDPFVDKDGWKRIF